MFSIEVLVHAVRMLFHDLGTTARLTLLPFAVAVAADFLVMGAIGGGAAAEGGDMAQLGLGDALAGLVATLCYLAGFVWAAVGWHRYGLLSEDTGGLIPGFGAAEFRGYFWASIKVGLAMFALLVPVVLVAGMAGAATGNPGLANLVIMLGFIPVLALTLRLSLVLPAIAIGGRMTFREALAVSKGYTSAFAIVSLATWAFGALAEFATPGGPVGLVVRLMFSWFGMVLSLSVLTTLYGVLVEKRELG
ncbi:hypothetical protein [Seohaeicola zhoushanensis]|uniref:Uncharacterized protein n=1 Tax=Seohaeicola zhoushanensis TaxID=1569283 RepID=A0A8J3H215_9RHOB|nr:hypothetical protein [Seohaeicola zhoushanensis]GHF73713.1 hypothetical protein GCM10017056_50640 [Seohaeicola zhoushanensis]